MPNNYTYRFSDRDHGKRHHHHNQDHHHHHGGRVHPHHHGGLPLLPFYPPYRPMPPWFWLLSGK